MRKAGDILEVLFREHFDPQFLGRVRTTAGLFSSWAAAVEEAGITSASAHSRIRDFERGMLLVEAEHPGWVQILQTKQTGLLKAVQGRYPELEIRGISFCLSREPISDPESSEETLPAGELGASSSFPPEGDDTGDGDFHSVMKRLEKSIKKRNKFTQD
jgi:hypothetical protein